MKKVILPIIILSFIFGAMSFAQDAELPDPGLTPDSPFYFLETIIEEIGTFFTFGDLKKAERHATLAAERLAEAQAVVEKGKPEFAEKTLQRYEMQLQNSIARAEKAQAKGKNTEKVMEVVARVGQATQKHLEVLAEIYEKVPEEDKPAIENAMKVSVKGHEKAVEALKAQDALGEVPEEASLPTEVPAEVRERIQTRAQQELEIEKALEGIDTSKSLRDICAEKGGTPEMCEEFPLEKFKSFKQIEDFCTESGGPQEICTTLEDKCREFGVTTANECFLLLSISSIKTYQSAELKFVPIERDPDCGLDYRTYGQTKYCCEDSDGSSSLGKNHYYKKGILECKVIDTTDGRLISHEINTDFCDGDRLTEWIRDNRHQASSEEYDCPQGCEDGACMGELSHEEIIQEAIRRGAEVPEEDVSSNLGGIGAEIGIKNNQLVIVALREGSPAEKAGLRAGDKILAIGGTITTDLTIDEAVQLISGEIGTRVVLLIRNNEEGVKSISIIRSQVE